MERKTLDPKTIISKYENGIGGAKLAREFKCSDTTIYKILKRSNIKKRPRNYIFPSSIRLPTSKEILAYTAGLFDGEGCIHTAKFRHGMKWRNHTRVTITNTNLDVLNWISKQFGVGKIYRAKDHFSEKNNRVTCCYIWALYPRNNVSAFIKSLLPYLIIKKSKALEALNVIENE